MELPRILLQISPVLLAVLGAIAHEAGHYVLGLTFGGKPSIAEYSFGIPTMIDFETPREMEDWQVRIVGGFPYVFLVLLFIGAWYRIEWLVFFAGAGGISISPSDLNAAWHPEFWKKLTARETLHPEDYID